MKKTDFITKIATLLKLKPDELTKALDEKEEVTIELQEDLSVFTKTELESRDEVQKGAGIKIGKEIGVKEVRTEAGLDESVGKDPKKVAEAIFSKAVADAKIPANDKITELTKQNSLLTQKLGEKDAEIEVERKKSSQVSTDRKILTAMPKNRTSLLEDDEMLDAVKAKHIKEIDGNLVVIGKDGEPLRDSKTTKPLDLNTGLLQIFTDRKWLTEEKQQPGGRGGKDEKTPAGVFTKKSEVIAHYESEGKSINGEYGAEIVAKLSELSKADTGFDMNN